MLVSEAIDRTYLEWLGPAGIDRPAVDRLASTMTNTTPAAGASFTTAGLLERIPPHSVVEIGTEIISLEGATPTTCIVHERGYYNTIAAAHAIGDEIRVDPKYPRLTLFNHLKSVIGMLVPWGIYRRQSQSTFYDSTEVMTLPTGADRILSILIRQSGSDEVYTRLTRPGFDWILYREFEPPKYHMRRGGPQGADMVVNYTQDFTLPTAETDDLDTLGIPTRLQPYLPLGVAGFALQGREIPRVQIEEIRRALAVQGVQVGTALNVGQAMLRAFRYEYVMAERRRQVEEDPPQLVWARSE